MWKAHTGESLYQRVVLKINTLKCDIECVWYRHLWTGISPSRSCCMPQSHYTGHISRVPHSSLLLDQSWLNMGKGWCLIFFYFTLVGITALWSHHSAARWSDFVQIEQGSGSWQGIELWFLSGFSSSQRHMNRLLLQTSMWKAGTLIWKKWFQFGHCLV